MSRKLNMKIYFEDAQDKQAVTYREDGSVELNF